MMFSYRATPRPAAISAASKIILNSCKLSGTNVISAALAFGGLMWFMLSSAIWIAGIYISALRALNVKIEAVNFYLTQAVSYDDAKAGAAVAV